MDYAKKLKLGFRLDDLDLTRKKNEMFQSSREEVHVPSMTCPCGSQLDGGTYVVKRCKIHKQE